MLTFTYRYNRIVKYFKYLNLEKGSDKKVHHIIPKSCGGTNKKENLLVVPTRWHYILHCWLPFVYLEQNNQDAYYKMLAAWHRMNNFKSDFRSDLKDLKIDSKLYERLRVDHSNYLKEVMSEKQSGSKNSNYGKHWWKDPNDRTKSKTFRDNEEIPEGWIRGKWQILSEQSKLNIQKRRKKNLRYITITNGEINLRIKKDEEIPEGFRKIHKMKTDPESFQRRCEAAKRGGATRKKALYKKHYPVIKEQFEFWLSHSWKEFVEKYNYKYSHVNFVNQCKKYLKEEWHPKRNKP
jgi:hypothetical protein